MKQSQGFRFGIVSFYMTKVGIHHYIPVISGVFPYLRLLFIKHLI